MKKKYELYEKVLNWRGIRLAVIDECKSRGIEYRGDMPIPYLQNVWHNRQSNKSIKEILVYLIGPSQEDKEEKDLLK